MQSSGLGEAEVWNDVQLALEASDGERRIPVARVDEDEFGTTISKEDIAATDVDIEST